ncbi:hypothetical protein PCCS19_17240 [Paenibacillus sp. CCS19]|uniref:YhcN/YlaJ family sporulation lipoprotein n=1 Tax=Paenibacillus sp. CCS19 TaxID=3158387 RepID=UPI00256B608A|nr:YhcN/YlaJ family sporulation lipoprotein [Paenibacillus cellulosilyticus]GMK38670.1 hypothetical protein PCCS19_17240 [Paenibacillus cellulosilyticus]
MRKTTGAVLLLSLMIVTTTACGTSNHDRNNGVTTNRYQSQSVRNYHEETNRYRLNNVTGMDQFNRNNTNTNTNSNAKAYNRALAEKLSKKAAAVRGVSEATAVVYGNDAIIGIDVKNGMNANSVAQKVHNSVRADAKGLKVHITGDKNIHSRIRSLQSRLTGLGTGIHNGLNDGTSIRSYGTSGIDGTYGWNGDFNNNRAYGLNRTDRLGPNGRYDNTRSFGLGDGTFNRNHNGTDDALGLNNRMNNRYQSLGANGSYNLYGTDGTDYLRHPVRSLGNDIRAIIDDIGDVVTAPLR